MAVPSYYNYDTHAAYYLNDRGLLYMPTTTASTSCWDFGSTSSTAYNGTIWNEWVKVSQELDRDRTLYTWRIWNQGSAATLENRYSVSNWVVQGAERGVVENEVMQRIAADRQRFILHQQEEMLRQQMERTIGEMAYTLGGQAAQNEYYRQQLRQHGLIETNEFPVDPVMSTEYQKIQENRKKAEQKAQKLLGELIGEDELAVYEETKRLFVKGKKCDYIVPADGFVKAITKDKVIDLCIHLKEKDKMPHTDNVIALKMMIEADEDKVWNMANKHGEYCVSSVLGLKVACAGGIH